MINALNSVLNICQIILSNQIIIEYLIFLTECTALIPTIRYKAMLSLPMEPLTIKTTFVYFYQSHIRKIAFKKTAYNEGNLASISSTFYARVLNKTKVLS